ncbi:MAG: DUF502 domain-containing protein [Candidatus Krumholzibacteriia bacterium]
MAKLRQYFLAGLLSVAPLVITGWVLLQIYRLVDGFTRPWLERIAALRQVPGFFLTLGGLAAFLLLILLAGILMQNVFGVALFGLVERWLRRVPLLRIVFDTTKQIGEVVLNPQRNAFQRVVLLEFPRSGCWSIGFITGDDGRQDLVAVFVATTPNPTSGFLLLLPRSQLRMLPLSIEEGVRLVVSGGALLTAEQARVLGAAAAGAGSGPGGAA